MSTPVSSNITDTTKQISGSNQFKDVIINNLKYSYKIDKNNKFITVQCDQLKTSPLKIHLSNKSLRERNNLKSFLRDENKIVELINNSIKLYVKGKNKSEDKSECLFKITDRGISVLEKKAGTGYSIVRFFCRLFLLKPSYGYSKSLITKQELPEEVKKLPLDNRVKSLLVADDQSLLEYFNAYSFLDEFNLKDFSIERPDIQITEDQTKLLVRLLQFNHRQTTQDVQNTPLLRHLVTEELKKHLEASEIDHDSKDRSISEALDVIDNLKDFVTQENLLQILIFVRENRSLMGNGTIGRAARSRPEIRKFSAKEYKIPMDFEYNPTNGELAISLGELGRGAFKVVKSNLLLTQTGLSLEALGKQDVSISANKTNAQREIAMLDLAKGLSNVISCYKVTWYTSVKKGKEILATLFPVYNMGELKNHLNSETMTQEDKLRIAADILRGVVGLHERGILHRDIKSANIFLHKASENGKAVVRAFVGDLGLACLKEDHGARKDKVGTPEYMPPEVLKRSQSGNEDIANEATDAWAIGVTLSELFNGIFPFEENQFTRQQIEVREALQNQPAPVNTESIEYVIWKLMRPLPSERMSLPEALSIIERLISEGEKE